MMEFSVSVFHSSAYHVFKGQEPGLGVVEEVRVEWGKELSVASQIADERHWYFPKAKSSEEKWASGERVWRKADRKMSGSPSSKRKVV